MNTRITVPAALAAGLLFALAPAQAQAPGMGNSIETLKLETKIAIMQQQISALQLQVTQLQAQLRAASPATVHPLPLNLPGLNNLPNLNNLPGLNPPGQQTFVVPQPPESRNGSIPNYTATFISQPAH